MKTKLSLLMLAAMLISSAALAHSDKELPLSTKSKAAKTAYHQAVDRLWNAHPDQYNEKINEAITADPEFFMAHADRALFLSGSEKTENQEKASKLIESTLALPQDNLTDAEKIVRNILVALRDKDNDVVKQHCDELIKTYPESVEAYGIAAGVTQFGIKDKDAGIVYLKQITEKFPDFGPAWNQLGYHYMDKNEMDKAEMAFNNYLRLNPNEANAHDSMGDFCVKKGDYNEAVKHFDQAIAMGMDASKERAEKARALAQGQEDTDTE